MPTCLQARSPWGLPGGKDHDRHFKLCSALGGDLNSALCGVHVRTNPTLCVARDLGPRTSKPHASQPCGVHLRYDLSKLGLLVRRESSRRGLSVDLLDASGAVTLLIHSAGRLGGTIRLLGAV